MQEYFAVPIVERLAMESIVSRRQPIYPTTPSENRRLISLKRNFTISLNTICLVSEHWRNNDYSCRCLWKNPRLNALKTWKATP